MSSDGVDDQQDLPSKQQKTDDTKKTKESVEVNIATLSGHACD